jgi:hypothetical protein
MSEVWYKVAHPWFMTHMAYRAVAFTMPSESAWSYLTFILPTGHTVSVQVWRCTALPARERTRFDGLDYSRPLTEAEKAMPWAKKPRAPNPDLDLDLQ